jgi:hypothetical protein
MVVLSEFMASTYLPTSTLAHGVMLLALALLISMENVTLSGI